jgi:hypothetical protein
MVLPQLWLIWEVLQKCCRGLCASRSAQSAYVAGLGCAHYLLFWLDLHSTSCIGMGSQCFSVLALRHWCWWYPFHLVQADALLHALIVTSTVEVHGSWVLTKLLFTWICDKIWVVISDEHWLFYTGDGTWIVLYAAPFCCRSHIEISLQTGF